jgi:2-(1,2-epoxy-1,2-dihydrophenyl)acetyl-CoA isomerase
MEPLLLSVSVNGVCRLTFNRPAQRNAMSVEMLEALHEQLQLAESDPAIRCIVIDGAGEHFSAGGDVKSWSRLRAMSATERGDDFEQRLNAVFPLVERLDAIAKPVIVAVRGYCVGAALSFVLAADFVVADESAKFIFANIRAALVPDMGITYYLPRAVGRRAASRLCLLGSQIDALQARELGIVDEVVAADGFEVAIANLSDKMTAAPALALKETKKLLHLSQDSTLLTQYAAEVHGLALCAGEPDFMEVVEAFSERRTPQFNRTS